MDWTNLLTTIWTAMNSPIGITIAAAVVAMILKRVYLARPAWKAYEGTIIAAIKYAEKEISGGPGDTGVARLENALQYVLRVYAKTEGRVASRKVTGELEEAIGVKHAELEKNGNLTKSGTAVPVRRA